MSSLFDDNNEEERQEQKLYEFYEVFSLEVRRQLLAKNIPIIQNVYDVLYPQTKNTLLSKNVTSDITIDSTAESVRNALVAKLVAENINIDTISENFRKQLISKNVLADSSRELQYKIDQVRKNLLSKNKNSNPNTIDSVSDSQRRDSLSKNKEPLNKDKEIERDNISFRENNLSKNAQTENTLDEQSAEFRKNNIHKNVDSDNDLDRQGQQARDNNLAKNATLQNNKNELDTIANEKRNVEESRNVPKENLGLDVESEEFRNSNIAKNVPEETSLEDSSGSVRDNNLSKNDSSGGDLLEDSSAFRKQDLSSNIQSTSDLLTDSQFLREDDLSKNTPTESNLLDSSEEARLNDLSKNDESKNDLLADSELIRKDDLSKNTSIGGDLLIDSEGVRDNNLSSNTPKTSDISVDSESFRKDNLSKNALTESDLELGSEDYRIDDLSKNKPNESDLFADSSEVRNDNISKNVETGGDLLTDSTVVRDDSLSKTVPVITSLEALSQDPREDLLSKNTLNPSDLLDRGVVPREDLLATNVPSISELLSDSEPFRDDLLAINVPVTTDLLFDSEPFRDNVLSENVPTTTDLLNDSVPYYANNLSANVPTQYDILDASQTFLDANLASNNSINSDLLNDSYEILQDNLAPNVPTDSDLLTDSETYLTDNLASNVPNTSDLLAESIPIRNDLIASNQPGNSDLLNDSTIYRDNLVAQNDNAELGVTFEGFGTFSYLGVSKVALQGLVIRSFLKSKNQPNFSDVLIPGDAYKENLLSKNDYVLHKNDYSYLFANKLTDKVNEQGIELESYFSNSLTTEVAGQMNKNFYVNTVGGELQKKYAPVTPDGENFTNNVFLGKSYYGISTNSPQGGFFDSNSNAGGVSYIQTFNGGEITQAIRKYNIARNIYNLAGIQNLASMTEAIGVLNSNNDLGFQDLINKTIGAFHTPNNSISAQPFGNLIPSNVLEMNNNLYLRKSAEEMMGRNEPTDPQLKMSWVGTPESMMQKTIAGNPLQEPAFDTAQRGVKHIMKSIRNNPNVKMSVNYDPQKTNKYVIKQTQDGTPKYASQRFTIKNPYSAPSSPQTLIFSLKNYSIGKHGKTLYLPPYIDSFSDSHSANWNEINFLGRPEPIYTYNNSKRDGSISFFVLTDFSQQVLIGRDWDKADMNQLIVNPTKSFTSESELRLDGSILDASGLIEELGLNKEKSKELEDFKAAENASSTIPTTGQTEEEEFTVYAKRREPETAQQTEYQKVLTETKDSLEKQIDVATSAIKDDLNPIYTLDSKKNKNIYDFMTSNTTSQGDEYISSPGDTLKRLDVMAKGTLFQPAFFSGSKDDFVSRMDFLAKLTKPAQASKGSGYSFTSPPVAHIKLGDWWNHDIVVKTVSVDYTDAPWTLDRFGGSGVQPMWAKVTISFDFVGRYGGEGAPVLSTDSGGVYST